MNGRSPRSFPGKARTTPRSPHVTHDSDLDNAWPLQVAAISYIGFSGVSGKGGGEMAQVLALLLFVAAVALWLRHTARQKTCLSAPAATRDAPSRYHCVEVCPGVHACKAARQLGHVRYLSSEAPGLPVSGCTEPQCACRYIHHPDRRQDDRRDPYGEWANVLPVMVGERRSRTERRTSRESVLRPSIVH